MEKERLYKITIREEYDGCGFVDSCPIAAVKIKSESAEKAVKEALKKVKEEVKCGPLSVGRVECLGCFQL